MGPDYPNKEKNCQESSLQLGDINLHDASNFLLSNSQKNLLEWIETHGYDMVVVCDLRGKILRVSKSVHKVLGYREEELTGSSILQYLAPDDKQVIATAFNSPAKESQKFYTSVRNCFGKYIWTETTIGRVYDEKDSLDVFVLLLRDIQDKKEAEEMMIRSEKMSIAGQLAAGVAHEVRNPLTAIKGFLQLLQAGVDRREEYCQIMIDEIKKIENITTELLFISKPITDEKQPELLSEMLGDVVTLLSSQARLQKVDILIEMEEDYAVYCDRSQIKQVFINLIKNAVEAMTSEGKVQVIAKKQADVCYVDVIDEGPGIPENIIHKLKEPFFTTKKEGTGLGLMISSQILEKHGGELEIYQNAERGSTFRIKLPLNNTSSPH